MTNLLSKKRIGFLKGLLEFEWSQLSLIGRFISFLLLAAILASKLLCLPKPRRSKYEVPDHWGTQSKGDVCGMEEGLTAVSGTVLWRSVNLGSIRPPERVGFPAGIIQTRGPALKNTLASVFRNASLPWLVKVSQNISALQCYTRREPDSKTHSNWD